VWSALGQALRQLWKIQASVEQSKYQNEELRNSYMHFLSGVGVEPHAETAYKMRIFQQVSDMARTNLRFAQVALIYGSRRHFLAL
jgi:hypothetical protein